MPCECRCRDQVLLCCSALPDSFLAPFGQAAAATASRVLHKPGSSARAGSHYHCHHDGSQITLTMLQELDSPATVPAREVGVLCTAVMCQGFTE